MEAPADTLGPSQDRSPGNQAPLQSSSYAAVFRLAIPLQTPANQTDCRGPAPRTLTAESQAERELASEGLKKEPAGDPGPFRDQDGGERY